MNVIPTLKYIWLTIRHKTFVFMAGLKTGAPIWRLVIHDWSKFTPAEAPHYGRQFFGDKIDPDGFARAWLHHQNTNPHHWEYWIPRTKHFADEVGSVHEALPMPEHFVREMVADWMGAGRVYEGKFPSGDDWTWLKENLPTFIKRLHPRTRRTLSKVLKEVGVTSETIAHIHMIAEVG